MKDTGRSEKGDLDRRLRGDIWNSWRKKGHLGKEVEKRYTKVRGRYTESLRRFRGI
jgi:hypothetical protein